MSRSGGGSTWMERSALFTGESVTMYVAIGLMGALNGLLAGSIGYSVDATVLGVDTAVWFFLGSWITTIGYLSGKLVPSEVVAAGCQFVVLLVLLQPVALYGPVLVAATDASGTASAQFLVDGLRGLVVGGVVSGTIALAITFVRRYLGRRATRVRHRRTKRDLHMNHHN